MPPSSDSPFTKPAPKVTVKFVELTDTIPVQGPESVVQRPGFDGDIEHLEEIREL